MFSRQSLFMMLLISGFTALGAFAQYDMETDKTLSPYFFIKDGNPELDQLPLKKTNTAVTINGVIAGVKVTQVYCNTGTRPIHARYIFPASTRAAVHGMTMKIGNHTIEAKIQEKEEAKKTFEQAKKAGKSASLLEQKRPNVFSMNVANVMPGDTISVELRYTEYLVPTDGTYEFIYPTVVGPRYSNQPASDTEDNWVQSPYLPEGEAPTIRFNITSVISTGVPIQEITCTSHKTSIEWKSESVAEVRLDESEEYGGNRDYILKFRLSGKQIMSGLMLYEGKDENFFCLMVQPPDTVQSHQIPPREYIFVMDVSGSMYGFPLEISKALVRDLIGHLRSEDTFNLLLFAGSSCLFSPSSLPATRANVDSALNLISRQRGGGGTEMLSAIKRAMELPGDENRSRSIVIATDGYVSFEESCFRYIQNNLNRANVFAFGIGSSVNRYLIEGIAKAGQGEPFVITRSAEAGARAVQFRQYIESPVLTNINIQYEGFKAYDTEPKSFPDLLARRPVVVFGKYKGEPEGTIRLKGLTGDGEYIKTFRAADSRPLENHHPLKYLWARTRIEELSDKRFTPEGDMREEIVSLGLRYNLMSRYTSFVAVYDVVRNTEGAEEVTQPLPLPKGVSNFAVGQPMANLSEPELHWIVPAVICLLIGFRLHRYTRQRSLLQQITRS